MDFAKEKICLEFEMSQTGHQIVEAKINGKLLRFILDTAAGSSVLSKACLIELGIQEVSSKEKASGLGTSEHEMGDIVVPEIELGGTLFGSTEFVSLNLEHVQAAGGEKGVHGLLGSPFFSKYAAIIDFGSNQVVLSNPIKS
ncbi:aspartyl protease family protein [Pseudoalteromonas mariniglutinosa]|uniref:aspartyl protease family protein n=1 Tax=Pseudoalteromonas mariniglutinosa TaxID=206042 RepID=UPI00384C6B35